MNLWRNELWRNVLGESGCNLGEGIEAPKVGAPNDRCTESQNLYFASDIINFGYVRLKDVQKVLFSPS